MRILFVKTALKFPRSSGHDVHAFGMMRGLEELGHQVGLLTVEATVEEATAGLSLAIHETFDKLASPSQAIQLPHLQRRFCSYWGIPTERIRQVEALARDGMADAVVAVGLEVLPYLAGVKNAVRVWYAADEWALHHLSQLSLWKPVSWEHLQWACIKGLYERTFRSVVDRVWVVSRADQRAVGWVMSKAPCHVIPNGVDTSFYAPQHLSELDHSCSFWGRLDFGPNQDALKWFCRTAWPRIVKDVPQARFFVYGFHPTHEIERLAEQTPFHLIADLPDIREAIARHPIAVMPFVSGAGIKNKLLEAASMERSIVASPTALNGIEDRQFLPLMTATHPREWSHLMKQLWSAPQLRRSLGERARRFVQERYTWQAAAKRAVNSLETESIIK